MKILSASEIRKLDQFTIENEPISSIDLMERAAITFSDWYRETFDDEQVIRILCGPGNNGGDGLAIARILSNAGYKVEIDLVNPLESFSNDAEENLNRLPKEIPVRKIKEVKDIPLNYSSEIIIDALFGSGLNRPLEGIYAEYIHIINNWDAEIISIDIPSGVFCDQINSSLHKIKATYTLSFQLPKMAFLLEQNAEYIGEWIILDIGLSDKGIEQAQTENHFLTISDIRPLLRQRQKFDHKGKFGHACVMAGSKGKMGAAVLATLAALRSGAGLVTAYVPKIGYHILQTAVPEAMCLTDIGENCLVDIPDLNKFSSLVIGPGIDQNDETLTCIESLLEQSKIPIIFDADALNILSKNEHLLKLIPKGSILTPHPGEFKRLAGTWEDDLEKLALQRVFSKNYQCIIILKGAHTSISDLNGNIYFNSTGNPGMATAGSGDVLSGIICALMAQGINSLNAAKVAVFLHGLAGDLALDFESQESLIAGDIISNLGNAFFEIN